MSIRVHYFLNVFLAILHTPVALMFIYCNYTSVAKLITIQISRCMEQKEQMQAKDALLSAGITTKPTALFPKIFLFSGVYH
jgi:hypothetical protein